MTVRYLVPVGGNVNYDDGCRHHDVSDVNHGAGVGASETQHGELSIIILLRCHTGSLRVLANMCMD